MSTVPILEMKAFGDLIVRLANLNAGSGMIDLAIADNPTTASCVRTGALHLTRSEFVTQTADPLQRLAE